MIQSLRNIKLRIKSIEATKKISRAMEMVSSSKLSRVKGLLFAARPYYSRLENILDDLLSHMDGSTHPLLEDRPVKKVIAVCVVTSDTGLCSTYNTAVIKVAEDFIRKHDPAGIRLVNVGKEGLKHFRKHGYASHKAYVELFGRYTAEVSEKIAADLSGMFLNSEVDEVYIAYTRFDSTLHHKPLIEKYLNLEHIGKSDAEPLIVEPDAESVLNQLLPRYLSEKMRLVMLNAFSSEHAARMIAMKAATDNAKDLIETLTMQKNKARQAAITREVMEIAMSAEALRG